MAAARQAGIARWQGAVKVNFTIKPRNGSFQGSLKEFRLIFTVARKNLLVECVARPGGFLVHHGWCWIGDDAASDHLVASGSVGVDPEYSGIFFKQALSFTPGRGRSVSALFQLFKIPVTPTFSTTKNRVSG